jgi:serine/threonine protein kinase
VMELVEGRNLAQLVADEGPLSPERALAYTAQAARALAHAHERGLVHRDVKPGNLMIGQGEQIKLVDMGLARFFDAVESASARKNQAWHTRTGHLMGTIDYMAPEQAEELGLCDVRSDIYSLGCTLFFLLTGASHLRGRTQRRRALALVSCQGMIELSSLRQDLPPSLYALVSRMTQLDPEARFQTMAEVLDAMEDCAQQMGVTLSPCDTGCRILVVEDSLVQSLVTRQNLAAISPHFSTREVSSLAAAIEACRQQLSAACLAAGADDFLPKQEIEPGMLQRHILLAISRKRNCR